MSDIETDAEFRGIISHALLGEDDNISKEGFNLVVNECVKFYKKRVDKKVKELNRNHISIIKKNRIHALEKRLDKLEEYTCHTIECELNDNTLANYTKRMKGYKNKCTCGLGELLNPIK